MRKFALPAAVVMAFAAIWLLTAQVDHNGTILAAPAPTRTATSRDWDALAPDGNLKAAAVKAESAIVVDSNSGKVLFEKNADEKRYPASTTKIMTCLLAIEKLDPSQIVTVGKMPALDKDSSVIGLKNGETLTVDNLIYGLMLHSGNDAAAELAMLIGNGSTPEDSLKKFADMMNAKAQELGMAHTHYTNPHGLPDEDHYTTARDMATLAMAARKYPKFVQVVSTYKYTMPATNKTDKPRTWTNSNKLISEKPDEIYAYKYATGIKTGYTTVAKQCLVTSAHKDNMDCVAVVLKDAVQEDKWVDSVTMFEYAFNFYDTLNLNDLLAAQTITTEVQNAADADSGGGTLELQLQPDKPSFLTDSKDQIEKLRSDITLFEKKVDISPDLKAPIKQDQQVGMVTFSYNGNVVLTCKLLATRDVNEKQVAPNATKATGGASAKPNATASQGAAEETPAPSPLGILGKVLLWAAIVVLVLAIAGIAIRMVNLNRRSKKYRQYNYRNRGNKRR